MEKQVKDTDEMWRKRYADRFLNPSDDNGGSDDDNSDDGQEDDDDESPKTFEELFSAGDTK